jgi:hypothetical protein
VLHEPDGDGKQGCRLRKHQESDGEKPKRNNNSFVSALTTILEEIQDEEDEQDQL